MAQTTEINWTDCTFNPWIGCTKVSPGCAHCYAAELDDKRFSKTLGAGTKETPITHWGPGAKRHRTSDSNWNEPIKWNRAAVNGHFRVCTECGHREFRTWDKTLPPGGLSCCTTVDCLSLPESESYAASPRVFCASLADWLDAEVDIQDLTDLLALVFKTEALTWQLLTKRPQNWRDRLQACLGYLAGGSNHELKAKIAQWLAGYPPANVWIGTSAEDQERLDLRVPLLLDIPAAVRFLSCEPLLGPVKLPEDKLAFLGEGHEDFGINWVIAGGESGPGATPMHPDWVRSIRDQCQGARVPFLFKQWGEWYPHMKVGSELTGQKVGKKAAGRLLDGRTWEEFPQ